MHIFPLVSIKSPLKLIRHFPSQHSHRKLKLHFFSRFIRFASKDPVGEFLRCLNIACMNRQSDSLNPQKYFTTISLFSDPLRSKSVTYSICELRRRRSIKMHFSSAFLFRFIRCSVLSQSKHRLRERGVLSGIDNYLINIDYRCRHKMCFISRSFQLALKALCNREKKFLLTAIAL